LIKLSVS